MDQEKIKKLLKEYEEQKEIEDYLINRNLPVPNTTYSVVILLSVAFLVVIFGIPLTVFHFVKLPILWKAVAVTLFVVGFSEFARRYLSVKFVECYQHYAKEETRRRCICVPSCSEYAILCFKRYELIHALVKIRQRLFVTCYGSDYIIDWPQ